ncbi:MAG: CBS domain-containing protein [Nanoarchaeota archaeon]|nr:CBS domain-containing protein [Nanoarchaeota archaeon]
MDNIKVSDVMARNVDTVGKDSNLIECAKKMVRKKTGGLIIVDKKKLLGFISSKDILWALIKNPKADLSKIKALDISPKKIVTIKPSNTLDEAVDKMKKSKIYRLPVIDKKELVGIIKMKDILEFYPGLYDEFRELSEVGDETEKIKSLNCGEKEETIPDGICEECGERDSLYRGENGILMCASCLASI